MINRGMAETKEIIVYNLESLDEVARKVAGFAKKEHIFLFYGEMGAGKTTLIKSLCKVLGSDENVSSPTFSIVNEYPLPAGKIYHFDFYRLKNQVEALDMGCEEYFYSGGYCFIEWPEKIPDLLPEHFIKIEIEVRADNERVITLHKF
jgi:tRNA threonylcarbamoyladenosine biosynthesis protein TsaE